MKNQLLYIAVILISSLTIGGCEHSKTMDNDNRNKKVLTPHKKSSPDIKEFSNSQEEKDWKEFETMKALVFTSNDKEKERHDYYNGSFWHSRNFEENLYKNRLRLAKSFMRNYPESDHYHEVLRYYFTFLLHPKFYKSSLSDEKKGILEKRIKPVNGDRSPIYQQFRTLPYDIKARDKWLKEGDSLAHRFLKSDATPEEKVSIEIGVLGRDMRMSRYLLEHLNLDRKSEEAEYWELFDRYFWKEFIDRIDKLIYKYPNYYKWPIYIDQFINGITLDFLSPELREPLWEHFYKITKRPELFKEYPVISEIHKKTKKNLKAIKALKVFDETQPLQMQMIGMDGQQINLKDYRGKVVMLDFWSLRCGPCIREMPHVQVLYEKYKDRGFEVIGVAAEGKESEERVQKIIEKQGATWPQVLDRASDTKISYHSLYKIQRLPTVWLLDKDGIIVDKNARGDRLEPLIKKYIHLNE